MNGLIFQISKTSTSTSKERAVLWVLNLSLFLFQLCASLLLSLLPSTRVVYIDLNLTQKEKIFDIQYTTSLTMVCIMFET